MNDHDGLELLGEEFDSFRITFVRDIQEQEMFRRFGGHLAFARSLPLGAYEPEDLLDETDDAVSLEDDLVERGAVLQMGPCEGWAFAIECIGPYVPTEQLLAAISPGTTAISVERISSKWLRCLGWAENGVYVDGCEVSGPYSPRVQSWFEQAGVDFEDEDNDHVDFLFAPILDKVFGIRLAREVLEKPLFTGAFLFPPTQRQEGASQ